MRVEHRGGDKFDINVRGQHVSQVMAGVSKSKRCQCPPKVSFVERMLGGRQSSV